MRLRWARSNWRIPSLNVKLNSILRRRRFKRISQKTRSRKSRHLLKKRKIINGGIISAIM
jgi:hypothetical protein